MKIVPSLAAALLAALSMAAAHAAPSLLFIGNIFPYAQGSAVH